MTRPARFDAAVLLLLLTLTAPASLAAEPPVFAETDGLVAIEAEHFFRQTAADVRAFHLTHAKQTPSISPDGDANHVAGASGGAYLEILPDTRRTHDDKLIKGTNFAPEADTMAVLHYKVHITTPGRHYVWARAHSTGSEDNGLHVGLNGTWPESGRRMQWCDGKHAWRWESKQRTPENHCGEPHQIYLDIAEAGEHVVQFSMREDGFEFDKWLMTTDRDFKRPEGVGPRAAVHAGRAPAAFAYVKPITALQMPAAMFAEGRLEGYYRHNAWIAVDPAKANEEQVMEAALELGVEDISAEEEVIEVYTDWTMVEEVRDGLEKAGIEAESAEVSMVPQNTVSLDEKQAETFMKLIDALEDNDDVQNVYSNADIPDEVMANL